MNGDQILCFLRAKVCFAINVQMVNTKNNENGNTDLQKNAVPHIITTVYPDWNSMNQTRKIELCFSSIVCNHSKNNQALE